MRLRHALLVPVLICAASPALRAAEDSRRDGNWWQEQSRVMKVCYMVGFFDGMELGNRFSYGKQTKNDLPAAARAAIASYAEYSSKYFSNVTSGQLVDGVDAFFNDYRNRRILVYDAIWLVVNAIAGTPQDQLDKMIENWRKNAR